MDRLVRVMTARSFLLLGTGVVLLGGVFAAGSIGGARGSDTGSTTTAATTATAPPTTTSTAPPSATIAEGVSIGGVPVGGMTRGQARQAVLAAYMAPIKLQLGLRHFSATPKQLGFHAYTATPLRAAYAIGRTSSAPAGDIPLVTRLAGNG